MRRSNFVYILTLASLALLQSVPLHEAGTHPDGQTLVVATVDAGLGSWRQLASLQSGLTPLQPFQCNSLSCPVEECSAGIAAVTCKTDI